MDMESRGSQMEITIEASTKKGNFMVKVDMFGLTALHMKVAS